MKVDRAVNEREPSHGRQNWPQTAPVVTVLMSVYNDDRLRALVTLYARQG